MSSDNPFNPNSKYVGNKDYIARIMSSNLEALKRCIEYNTRLIDKSKPYDTTFICGPFDTLQPAEDNSLSKTQNEKIYVEHFAKFMSQETYIGTSIPFEFCADDYCEHLCLESDVIPKQKWAVLRNYMVIRLSNTQQIFNPRTICKFMD